MVESLATLCAAVLSGYLLLEPSCELSAKLLDTRSIK